MQGAREAASNYRRTIHETRSRRLHVEREYANRFQEEETAKSMAKREFRQHVPYYYSLMRVIYNVLCDATHHDIKGVFLTHAEAEAARCRLDRPQCYMIVLMDTDLDRPDELDRVMNELA